MKALSLLALASGLLGCQSDDPAPGQTFNLVYQQPATVAGISATLADTYDSRCPSGAQCIWAGYAAVTVNFSEGSETQTISISLHQPNLAKYKTDSALVTLNKHGYWLRLLAVNPAPSTTPTTAPRTATFRLRPQ